ncbi:PQQ-binding-like beta-propeller repeat protein [Stratiformator vulcanicus]|uniref:Outer membrane biogenesis protein BamB n=1 Tax=Stratiformator vulcanicus TaxID=2527980 RepID=A0A517R2U4_9PLAN|nr:PQQ-binding-like beta-propeller repeat protein [Stratiformator vulcanicus]QDT38199.1 outer membrane biogenesis protein BamB [Stratiformator vulcanicus]
MATETTPPTDTLPEQTEKSSETGSSGRPLRRWPLVILLLLIPVCWYLQLAWETPPLTVMMMSFFGPLVVGAAVVVWWLFASRASWPEKLLALLGWSIVGAVPCFFLHPTMKGMGTMYNVIPTLLLAGGVSLLLFGGLPKTRSVITLLVIGLASAGWTLARSEGVTSDFRSELAWRWEPSAEEQYLASIERVDASDSEVSTDFEAAEFHWPEFRGPERDGKVHNVSIAEDWEANPPKLLWKSRIGPAWSSFAVAGPYLFTQEQRGDNEAVVCLQADTGEIVWAAEYESRFWEPVAGAGPRATPTVTAEGVFALGGSGLLHRLEPETGEVIWQVDIKNDADRDPEMPMPVWGFASSPLVHEGLVIVHAGGTGEGGVLAYDVESGELRWGAESGDHSYSSPQFARIAETDGILMICNEGVRFLDPADGSVLWNHRWPYDGYRVLQPVVDNDAVYISTGLGEGTRRLDVAEEDGDWSVDEAWTSRGMKPDFNDYIEHDGYIYGFDVAIFGCIDLETGKREWKGGRYGKGQAVLLTESNQILVLSEKGELVLLEANPDRHVELAKVPAIDGKTWNHPVVVGDRVYVRNAEEAACYVLPVSSEPKDTPAVAALR